MADIQIWFADDNDMVIEVADLINSLTGAFINDAVINATLKDEAGVDVAGQVWPVVIPYSATPGLYRVTVDKAVEVLDDTGYLLHILATTPGALDAEWRIKVGGETRS